MKLTLALLASKRGCSRQHEIKDPQKELQSATLSVRTAYVQHESGKTDRQSNSNTRGPSKSIKQFGH